PEPWTGVDVVVWQKMMAWDLSANYSWELLRHDVIAKVGAERMAELMPAYAADGLSVLSERDMPWLRADTSPTPRPTPAMTPRLSGAESLADLIAALSSGDAAVADLLIGSARAEAIGSNNWVADGTLT